MDEPDGSGLCVSLFDESADRENEGAGDKLRDAAGDALPDMLVLLLAPCEMLE